jgi:metal-responsive CopG/Arc/MetJ family transcriptional regulator
LADQLTIRLPKDLNEALIEAARRLERKRSEIVRLALAQFLGVRKKEVATPADRVRPLLGALESGVPDLAENHRAHVLEALKHGR